MDAVRVELGNTGSKSTIHRHLKELEDEEGQGLGAKVAVSDALQDLIGRLAGRLHEEAEAVVTQAQQRSRSNCRSAAKRWNSSSRKAPL